MQKDRKLEHRYLVFNTWDISYFDEKYLLHIFNSDNELEVKKFFSREMVD